MAAKSSDSETTTTRRRRTVRKPKKDSAAEDTGASADDASDVIFEESEESTPKPRRKKATRRKKAATRKAAEAEPEVKEEAVEAAAPPEEESAPPRRRTRRPRRTEQADDDAGSDEEVRDERDIDEEREARGGQSRSDDDDGDQRPRRRRRRRGRGRRRGGYGDERGERDNRDRYDRDFQGGGGGRGRRNDRSDRNDRRRQGQSRVRSVLPSDAVVEGTIEAVLELHPKGYGFLRDPEKNYLAQESDPFVPSSFVERNRLREGVLIKGEVGPGVRNQGPRLKEIETVEGKSLEEFQAMKPFEDLTPITPFQPITLETGPRPVTMRVMDLLTPVGKGQRALIVAPPRTGKTMLLQDIADAVSANHPDMHLMVLLIDERPEEVTEMRRRVKGEVIASSMDRDVESHVRMSQLMIERAKRMAEAGKDVFVLMDSITRMARAFNKWSGGGGARESRTMSGGLHVKALDIPKKLFGTARQFDEGGSLTIVATALIETGSKMDEVIFQEFKGTGNMELVLSRDLADRRIWPAIDITRSGTRHEEKLFPPEEFDSVIMLRRSLISLSPVEAMEQLTRTMDRFPTNKEFLSRVKAIL
jgi:transcription termination factor Rho